MDSSKTSTCVLQENEVHIWRIPAHVSAQEMDLMHQWLAPDERQRAGKFFFEKDRSRFIVARGSLRKILGLYLDCTPETVQFCYNEYGKPALALPEHPHLHFNLSHSRECILAAFTLAGEIGIDVEYMRADIEHEFLAEYHFSPYEQRELRSLPPEQQLAGFYACWTRKEAYIKARGRGLSLALDLFDVTLAPGQPASLVASRESEHERERWTMYSLETEPGYASALVVEGQGIDLKYFPTPKNGSSLREG